MLYFCCFFWELDQLTLENDFALLVNVNQLQICVAAWDERTFPNKRIIITKFWDDFLQKECVLKWLKHQTSFSHADFSSE